MSVPEEVRKVSRPKGTIVCEGKNGVYSVREKISGGYYRDDEGKIHRPSRNGRVVGHIIDMEFVEKVPEPILAVSQGNVDLKDWGNISLFDRLNSDLLEILRMHYNEMDSLRIYLMALLRATYEGISDRKLDRQYQETYLTEMYPTVNLSKNQVSKFLRDVGRTCSRISDFMRFMTSRIENGDFLIIDGSLRQDHSRVNSLSAVSRKTGKLGYKQILLMYAYSLGKRQPVCSKVYPGNMVDQRAVTDFIEEFAIDDAVIVADKGFPPASVKAVLSKKPGLHYLLPIKRNRPEFDRLGLLSFDERLEGESGIQCRKVSTEVGGKTVWYYCFRDPSIAFDEELQYMSTHGGSSFDAKELESVRPYFGTLAFESDMDLACGKAYEIYGSRWLIELFFRSQQDSMEMDDTREHSDYSVIASNFIDYLASIMLSRMLCFVDDKGLLKKNTFGDIMHLLSMLKMTQTGPDREWSVRRLPNTDIGTIESLGILYRPVVPREVKPRGRPKGSRDSVPRKRRTKSEMSANQA